MDDCQFKDYPYTDESTLYICHGCKKAVSIRTKKIYFRTFMDSKDYSYYKLPFCESCNKNPDTWWNY